jgi:site-specific DNA-methyltransferase (adenine-specific)
MELDTIIVADCVEWLNKQPGPFADLIFADPPFNIGYKYDIYQDRKGYKEYRAWTYTWMRACKRVLKPTGSFWVAIGDEYAAEVRLIGRKLGLHLRNWVIWHYTFGQSTKRKFARSHTHLFYWTGHRKQFTFNQEAIRIFSDRQSPYRDARANEDGKLPDDVWFELPRVCGTFNKRQRWHPCHMPEIILARILRACSKRDDIVLDPFAGSGTTLVVAKKLSRRYIGIEMSSRYARRIKQRLNRVEPIHSIQGENKDPWPTEYLDELAALYLEMKVPTDRLHKSPQMLATFTASFNARLAESGGLISFTASELWYQLERLRKAGKLPRIRVHAMEPIRGDIRPLQQVLFKEI